MDIIKDLESSDFGNLDSSMVPSESWKLEAIDLKHQNIFELQMMDAYVFPETSTLGGHERKENINVAEAPEEANPPQPHVEEFQPQVTKHLKEMVLQAVEELKRLCQPIWFRMPQATDSKRSKAKQLGDITKSFTIPAQLLVGHEDDLDNFPVPASLLDQLTPGFEDMKRYTFTERLENWRLLCKQRVNGNLDIYYEHGKSGEFFPSMVEVVNFIMYEICPRHFVKIARGTPIAEPSSQGTKGKKRSRFSSQISHDDEEEEMKIARTQEEAVEAFLKEAYENLQNLFKNENHRESCSKAARLQD